jgi:hypothetical protein
MEHDEQRMRKIKHASLLLAVVVVLCGIIAGGAGATTTIGAKKQRPIHLTLTGTSTLSQSTDTVTGTFTGTVGEASVSGIYTGQLTLGTPETPCSTMSAMVCWHEISGSFTFTFSGKGGSFTAGVDPGGSAGRSGTARHQEMAFFIDLGAVSGTGGYALARGQFSLSYSSVTDSGYPHPGQGDQHDSGTLGGGFAR